MNNRERYDFYRNNLAIGIARMAEKLNEYNINDNDFKDTFGYVLIQLRNFDRLWTEILTSRYRKRNPANLANEPDSLNDQLYLAKP